MYISRSIKTDLKTQIKKYFWKIGLDVTWRLIKSRKRTRLREENLIPRVGIWHGEIRP
jgi:hypothetical protein